MDHLIVGGVNKLNVHNYDFHTSIVWCGKHTHLRGKVNILHKTVSGEPNLI